MPDEQKPPQDWDPTSPEAAADYLAAITALQSRCPVAWSDAFGGFWSVSTYDGVAEVCLSPERFTSTKQLGVPHLELGVPWLPLMSDPPQHTSYRAVLAPFFARSKILSLEPELRELARDLLRDLRDQECFDAAAEFATLFSGRALCAALELPREFAGRFIGWNRDMTTALRTDDLMLMQDALADMADYVDEESAARRADPDDGFMSRILAARVDGRPLNELEILGYYLLLMSAGHNTASDSLGHAIVHLAQHPEHRETLRSRPEILPNAVEEIIRFYSPLLNLARTAAEDTCLGGRDIKAGDQVALLWGGAARDQTHLPDAHEFRLERPMTKHLSFGLGVHYCIGAELGRLQIRIAIEEFLDHFEQFTIAAELPKAGWPFNAYLAIPLTVTRDGRPAHIV